MQKVLQDHTKDLSAGPLCFSLSMTLITKNEKFKGLITIKAIKTTKTNKSSRQINLIYRDDVKLAYSLASHSSSY